MKRPAKVRHKLGSQALVIRFPAAGERDALPPEFMLSHESVPPYPIAAQHVNWEALTAKDSGMNEYPALDVNQMAEDELEAMQDSIAVRNEPEASEH
ncbi:hypothetical protein [Paenibacillus massiliensis]|uniref:hypothetical protein n=1 Tax=Paenibacillus massiliensis TaxID=225917 RepID=UPI0003640E4D|nr:hypothetical protein [Paenibacillus massiliensis]